MSSPDEQALLHEVGASINELRALLHWWRARQRFVARAADPAWETELHTFHVARPFLDLIRRQAEHECTTITEIVHRAFEQFFAGSETADDHHRSRGSRDRKASDTISPTEKAGVRR
jgi:hypothetical protein